MTIVRQHDSETFTQALDWWFPLVYAKTSTPRAIKRFLNRVRFYAMSQREAAPESDGGAHAEIPEEALVALSVLQHIGAENAQGVPRELRPDFDAARLYEDAFRHMSEGVSM